MKYTVVLLLVLSFNFSFANEISDEVDEILTSYDACTGEGYSQKELQSFLDLFKSYKKATPNVEVPDFNRYSITILDKKSSQECVLNIDPYDGRCYYALCN